MILQTYSLREKFKQSLNEVGKSIDSLFFRTSEIGVRCSIFGVHKD